MEQSTLALYLLTASMVPILQSIAALFKRPAEYVPPDHVAARMQAANDGLDDERRKYDANMAEIRRLESRNRLAYTNSRLDFLKNYGTPYYKPPAASGEDQRSSRHAMRPIPIYVKDEATGFPYSPSVHFEQDPLCGWDAGMNFDLLDMSSQVPVSAFPREMFPERPSTLRTQIAQDAIRFMSRAWYESMPQYSGCIGHLCDYAVGSGLTWDVVSDVDAQLAQDVADYLEVFSTYAWNNIEQRICDSALNLFRDGEDALRIFPGDEYPQIRSLDTSNIRGPHNEINGPWAMGVLTSWPRDYEDVQAYHAWYADNTHEDISPTLLKLCKLDTTGPNVKRGVPLAYKIRKALPQIARLVDCMAVGEAARQAIPYVQQYQMADKSAVGAALRANETHPSELFGDHGEHHGDDIRPGEVRHISKGQEFIDPPNAQGFAASGTGVYRTLCESCACATRTPIWFWTGSADAENYASSLVSESPVIKMIQGVQRKLVSHYSEMLRSVVMIGAAQGRFPSDVLKIVKIHVTLPTPVARNRKDEVETDIRLLDKKLISPQAVCKRNDLDFLEQTELTQQAEAAGWTNTMGVQPGEQLPGQGKPAGMNEPLAIPSDDDDPETTGNEPRREQDTFDESKHPRADDGKFGSGAGSARGTKDESDSNESDEPVKRPAIAKGQSITAKREGKGKDSRIVMSDGSNAPSHITPAMIPPAWENVQIFPDSDSEIWVKATMTGKNGKTAGKTVYKPSYEADMAAAKFTRINIMQAEIGDIDSRLKADRTNPKLRDAADAVFLMREQATRPGSEADTKGLAKHYSKEVTAENVVVTPGKGKGTAKVAMKFGDDTIPIKDQGTADEIQRRLEAGESLEDSSYWLKSHGATTLEGRHVVEAKDGVRLQFVGKEGVWHDHLIENPELAKTLLDRKATAGDKEKLFGTTDAKVSDYVKSLDHGRLSPKDLRTNRANEIAAAEVKKFGDEPPTDEKEAKARKMQVAISVSQKLGNRPQQCIESYIDPSVWSHPAFGVAS